MSPRRDPGRGMTLLEMLIASAAMLIVKKNGGVWLNNDVVLRLAVDDSPEPIKELRRLVEKAAEQRARFRRPASPSPSPSPR